MYRKPALVIVLLLVIRPVFMVTPLFITGPLLVKVPLVKIVPLFTKFSVLVNVPLWLSIVPRVFMIIEPDEVMTPVLLIPPLVVIVPVGPLVIVMVETMLPKLLNGPLFVIVPWLVMMPLLLTVPDVVTTPPLAIRIVPLFWITPLLVTVPMLRVTNLAIPTVSAGPTTRVPTVHVLFAAVQTPLIGADWHDNVSCIVVVNAITFWPEKTTSTVIMATSTGSTSAFFVYVIINLVFDKAIKSRLH